MESREDEAAKERRRKIMAIMADAKLTSVEKAKAMQDLMSGDWKAKMQSEAPPAWVSSPPTPAELAPSYQDDVKSILGCQHYQRGCKKRADCCGKFVPCRLCHDEAESHQIDRHATKEMMCMHCQTVQACAQTCSNPKCGKQLARYYCGVCKFWDDKPGKTIYHCPHCGICRIGKGLDIDFFHCFTCGACMSVTRREHKCIEDSLKGNCPICHQNIFNSTDGAVFLNCGHLCHSKCLNSYNRNNFRCPLCSKSMWDMSVYFRALEALQARQPMPAEFANTQSNILCNDCGAKAAVPFHYVGHQCPGCRSFNTAVLSTEGFPPNDVLMRLYSSQSLPTLTADDLNTASDSSHTNAESQLTSNQGGVASDEEDALESDEEEDGTAPPAKN